MNQNVDLDEIAKFSGSASHWWDTAGEFKPLHDINPLRLEFIQQHTPLIDKKVIDIGCGGGILAESLARSGAEVTAIDMDNVALNVATEHAQAGNLNISYQQITAEEIANTHANTFDVVTCMEMLEHVPDPTSVVQACTQLVKPGGQVFFSTLNRNVMAYLLAIVGAEYVLNMLPKGTHDYAKFIRPSELAEWARQAGLTLRNSTGIRYHPLSQTYALTPKLTVNYILHFTHEA